MKRSRNGYVIHRDDCRRAGSARHWNYADGMTDQELVIRILGYDHLRTCLLCFGASKEQLAGRYAAARAARQP